MSKIKEIVTRMPKDSKDSCQTCFGTLMEFKLLLTTYSYGEGETDEQHDKRFNQVLERVQQ